MKLTQIKHENVNPNGTFKDKKGAIVTNGIVRWSQDGMDDGFWVLILQPITDAGVVQGVRADFVDKKEKADFIKFHNLLK